MIHFTKNILIRILDKYNYRIVKKEKIDAFVISFPKCGRTWLNFMLGKLFENHLNLSGISAQKSFDLNLYHSFFPDKIPHIAFTHDGNQNFFRTAKQLKTNKNKYNKAKVIFLVRDPRDVIVSSYYEKTKRSNLGNREKTFWKPIKGTISDYVYEKHGGIDTIIEFYNIWYRNKNIPKSFMLLKYEDLHINTLHELSRIIDFLELDGISESSKKYAITNSSFQNMRTIESNGFALDKLKPANSDDINTYKTRSGKIGDYVNHLNENEIEYLSNKIKYTLNPFFGY